MVINPQYKPMTREEIEAENERIRRAMIDDTPVNLPAKPTPQQTIASLKDRAARFKTFPVPESYPTPVIVQKEKPRCDRCNNLGVIRYDVPPDHILYRKDVPCDAKGGCPVVAYQRQEREAMEADRQTRHFGKEIDYFRDARMSHYPAKGAAGAVEAARVFLEHGQVSHHDVTKTSLVFFGKVGRGKSYLISAMRNLLWERGESCQFRKIRTLLKAVQRGYNKDAEFRDYEVETMLMTTRCLFIDEFETGFVSGDRVEIFEAIIDHRYRENLPVIVACNVEQHQVRDIWGDRIASRIIHMAHWIEMGGDTLRDTSAPIRERK